MARREADVDGASPTSDTANRDLATKFLPPGY